MSDRKMQAKAMSVRMRLRNLAVAQGRPFDLLVQRYAIERLLQRIARSRHADKFILKGAMVFIAWGVELPRPTRDLDLMGFVAPDPKELIKIFQEILSVSVEEDGLRHDLERMIAELIREENLYSGVRVRIPAQLGTMRINLQVDVGIGDALFPEPEQATFPSLLGGEPTSIRSYSRYLVVAEKFEAMLNLRELNSRMKDYFDIWLLERSFAFDPQTLRGSIIHTLARRGTAIPIERPAGLSERFHRDPAKQRQWTSFLARTGITEDPPSLEAACDAIWRLVSVALDSPLPAREPNH